MTLDTQTVTGIVTIISALTIAITTILNTLQSRKAVAAATDAKKSVAEATGKLEAIEGKADTAIAQNVAIAAKADTAIEQNVKIAEKADTAIDQTNGNMTKMQEQLDKQIARADTLQDMLLSMHKLVEAMKPTAVVVAEAPILERRVRQEDLERSRGSKG